MATVAQIISTLADAKAGDVSYSDLATIVKRGILNALIDGSGNVSIPWQSTTSDGTSLVRMPIEQATALLDFCLKRACGGAVSQLVEFREPR